jgi:hypothetical protein
MTNVKHRLDEIDLLDVPHGWEDVRRRVARADLPVRIDEPQRSWAVEVGAAVLAFAIFIVAGGLLWEAFHTGPSDIAGSPIVLPSDPATVFAMPGLAFPVCRGSVIEGRFTGEDVEHAYVFTKATDSGCPAPGAAFQILALDAFDQGQIDTTFGPLECASVCSVWANPDIDGDGHDEIAVVTGQGASSIAFQLYGVTLSPGGPRLGVIADTSGNVLTIESYGPATHLAGAECGLTDTGVGFPTPGLFVVWTATPNAGQTAYIVVGQPFRVVDQTETGSSDQLQILDPLPPVSSTVALDPAKLPPSDITVTCGGTIQTSP